jgi:flavin-dependent thymidylate synthase
MEQTELFEPPPSVTLIDFTGAGRRDAHWHAADVLIFTKSTRLNMDPDLFRQIKDMKVKDKLVELEAMARTIPSSWEFVDVTFLISGVTRACAQQMTRTRTGSYAMQSQRVVDVSSAGVRNPATGGEGREAFDRAARASLAAYTGLIEGGLPLEQARGVLPMNTKCNLVAKYNFRSFVDLVKARSSLRTQDEYLDIIRQMHNVVTKQWRWSAPFFEPPHEAAIKLLEEVVKRQKLQTGSGDAWDIAKAIDLIRKGK